MKPIETEEDIARELQSLLLLDERLRGVFEIAGVVPLRRRAADFKALSNIIVSQLISVAAGAAIFGRLEALVDPFTPEVLLSKSHEELKGVGLSGSKVNTIRSIAEHMEDGLDLMHLAEMPADVAQKKLCEIKGIGRWTSDIFLLFCAGHPDVFPSGDVALQNAVKDAFGLDERPKGKELDLIAEAWAPHRGTAARLWWSYYKARREGRETLPI
ncbi:DNA-3-methyladenine glycosylase 2 family protein [Pseudovibrio sp. SPO723]|uniref:DNA-3-methyladenine glycosylase family protein n=1 Tax=Nesiotobacter zosterae TaxID=392721 RepID=UPI0029C3438F|nr:DNA-3-methyladenine glycosylase 2 family protein [Pseudovibrio sp. SPO723]MDX5594992.1 DNA-3-methyladenine glycosylase 2 family protein [Pseudovibrio sp. SPO723]